MTNWEAVLPGVLLWRDSCNVYALDGPDGCLIVDAGTGRWIDHVAELPSAPVAVLCTHFFRDHSAGAARAARELGLPVLVPAREHALFADPLEHHRARQTWIVYDNYWDHFAPIEPIPVSGVLRDDEHLRLAGLDLEVVPLPGATLTQVGIAFTPRGSGVRAVCSGETIHSPGRVPRLAPLQYTYNDMRGAVEVWHSAASLRDRGVDVLLPSLGEPILAEADAALAGLQRSLQLVCESYLEEATLIGPLAMPRLHRVSEHVWVTTTTNSTSAFIVAPSGLALALDYGYHHWRVGMITPAPHRRRALLHTLDLLRAEAGLKRVDLAIPSHYHDDHVGGLAALQRVEGTRCWVHDGFADILANPDGSMFPCTEPTPVEVERRLRDGEPVEWEGIELRVAAADGHTRFENLIGFEVDGLRFAHSGDQYSFMAREAYGRHAAEWLTDDELGDTSGIVARSNHVYRGGARLDSYARSGAWLTAWRPDVLLNGHWPVIRTDDNFYELLDERTRSYEGVHRAAMPVGEADVHFDVDSWGGWIWPYRLHLEVGQAGSLRATARNPFPHEAELEVRLVVPDGWTGGAATVRAAASAEASCTLALTPSFECRRRPVAIELVADGRPFGQVAEALVTVGGPAW
jgi:glyoxylase-like metal-dependent hydrolase (beta-lactamase superfamily II)